MELCYVLCYQGNPYHGGEMHYGYLGWQRGQKKFAITVTVQFYFKFENVIFLFPSVQ